MRLVRDTKNGVMRSLPNIPAGGYQTYEIDAPLETHWRQATCEEVECPHYLHGWATTMLPSTDDERFMLAAAKHFGIKFLTPVMRTSEGLNRYMFPPGQKCFKHQAHRVPLERDPIFKVWGGDWRGTDGTGREFAKAENWIDHFANHQDKIAKKLERG